MPGNTGLPTIKENTARKHRNQKNQPCTYHCRNDDERGVTALWSVWAKMSSILGLTTEERTQREKDNQENQPRTGHCQCRQQAQQRSRGRLSFWSKPAMMPSIWGQSSTEGNTVQPCRSHRRCRRRARPRGQEEVRGVRLFLLFFLFLLFPAEDDEEAAGAIPIHCLHAERSAADSGRSAWTLLLSSSIFFSCSAASISSFSFFIFAFSSSSSNFLLAFRAAAVRKRSVEDSTCSPNAPASTGRPRVGRQSLRSAAGCGHFSAARAPRGCPAALPEVESPVPVGRSASRAPPPALAAVFCPRGAPFFCISTFSFGPCQGHADGLLLVPKHRAQPPLTSSPSSSRGLPAELSHEIATQRERPKFTNLSELVGGVVG